ncbi:hypothetical protein [Massilia cavernae]|uniref:hypothetical protein n=1 Tax=Massilia cavernae TaxID=2320864 RepID=UPI0011C3A5CD|nr:hypothetical protein [Massilia cavernae]
MFIVDPGATITSWNKACEKPSSHEAVLIGKSGKRTPFLFTCARTSLGSIPCVFGTGLDISARKEAEMGLLVRERAIYSSVNAIVVTCLRDHDCDQMQGFYFSAALSQGSLTDMVQSNLRLHA